MPPHVSRTNPISEAAAVKSIAVARLRPFAANARTHSSKQIRQIADSIPRFGFTNPVLISDDARSSPATAASRPPSCSA